MAQGSKVAPCTCKHEFQDKEYGKGLRLHNMSGKIKDGGYCTVWCIAIDPATGQKRKHPTSGKVVRNIKTIK